MQDQIKSQKEQLDSKILEMQALEGKFDISRKDLDNAVKDLRQTKGALEKTAQRQASFRFAASLHPRTI